jgi:hypothetical protein
MARAELLNARPTLGPRVDPADALQSFGIEAEDVRWRLEATFGSDGLHTASQPPEPQRAGHARVDRGPTKPLRLLLEARGIDMTQLAD